MPILEYSVRTYNFVLSDIYLLWFKMLSRWSIITLIIWNCYLEMATLILIGFYSGCGLLALGLVFKHTVLVCFIIYLVLNAKRNVAPAVKQPFPHHCVGVLPPTVWLFLPSRSSTTIRKYFSGQKCCLLKLLFL